MAFVRIEEGTTTRAGGRSIVVRECSARTLTADLVSRWEDLEDRSLEGNPYLSPHFVLPALRNLPTETSKNPIVLTMESEDNRQLLGLGVFETSSGTRLLPLRHLLSWRSTHSFLDGVLLDRRSAVEAATALFQWLRQQGGRWHGISFRDRSADSELSAVLERAASRSGMAWHEDTWTERASIPTSLVPEDCIRDLYSRRRRENLRRQVRRLESMGDVRFELNWCQTSHQEPLDTFLELEAMGWKGEQKTALKSHPGHERFAREMVAGLSGVGRVLFCELSVEGEPVATGLCFRSGETLFTFKSGWNPRFSRCSPGVIVELKLLQAVGGLEGITLVDSCTVPGSWREDIWPWRRRLTTGVFPITSAGNLIVKATLRLKQLKRWLGGRMETGLQRWCMTPDSSFKVT